MVREIFYFRDRFKIAEEAEQKKKPLEIYEANNREWELMMIQVNQEIDAKNPNEGYIFN